MPKGALMDVCVQHGWGLHVCAQMHAAGGRTGLGLYGMLYVC